MHAALLDFAANEGIDIIILGEDHLLRCGILLGWYSDNRVLQPPGIRAQLAEMLLATRHPTTTSSPSISGCTG